MHVSVKPCLEHPSIVFYKNKVASVFMFTVTWLSQMCFFFFAFLDQTWWLLIVPPSSLACMGTCSCRPCFWTSITTGSSWEERMCSILLDWTTHTLTLKRYHLHGCKLWYLEIFHNLGWRVEIWDIKVFDIPASKLSSQVYIYSSNGSGWYFMKLFSDVSQSMIWPALKTW